MQNSKLPFRYWFVTMHLLTSTKKSFSTEELRRQLGHKRYQPIWEMVNKIRDIMGKRDNEYQLTGQMELDDAYFSTEIPQEQKDKPLKEVVEVKAKPKCWLWLKVNSSIIPRKVGNQNGLITLKCKLSAI